MNIITLTAQDTLYKDCLMMGGIAVAHLDGVHTVYVTDIVGKSWLYMAMLAHEEGHVYHRHLEGINEGTVFVPEHEIEADRFAARKVGKLAMLKARISLGFLVGFRLQEMGMVHEAQCFYGSIATGMKWRQCWAILTA